MARPEVKITDEQRKQVQTLTGYGLNQDQIAGMLGITRQTLAKHCGAELAKGKDLAYTQAVQGLFNNIKKGKEASIFFYLKTQHNWREKSQIDMTSDGKKIGILYVGTPPKQE